MCGIRKNQRTTKTNKMPSTKSTQCHDQLTLSKEKMPILLTHKSNYHNSHTMHSCGNVSTTPDQLVFINKSTPNKSIISSVHWQFSTKYFNRKWIYRYLLTLFILMYAINSSPILLSNAQILKSNRTSAAITQNFNNKIISNSGTGASSVTQKTSRNNRNNNIRKEHANSDVELNERPSCHSCSLIKDVEADNLRSFKNHILKRLQLERAPNISMESVTSVSESVLANFYNKYGERYIRRYGRNHEYQDDQMMGDEPNHFRTDKNRISEDDDGEDEDEQFFSTTQSIYSFPNGK